VHVVKLDLDDVPEAGGEPAVRRERLRIVAAVGSLRNNRIREQTRGDGQRRTGAQDVPKPFHVDLPVKSYCERTHRPAPSLARQSA
jgi:hypothetical protein